jgi:DNA-binding HxlR family transcriptional regulator
MSSVARVPRSHEPVCSIERCLQILSDRWSFLILREALFSGVTRFADFERKLGIAPNVLTDRLESLVAAGVLTRRAYQVPGSRTRFSYHPTPAGHDLAVPLAALQQWGDEHNPPPAGPTVVRRSAAGKAVRVGFLDEGDQAVPASDVVFVKTAAHPDITPDGACFAGTSSTTAATRRLGASGAIST